MKPSPPNCGCGGTGWSNAAMCIRCPSCQGLAEHDKDMRSYLETGKSPELRAAEATNTKLDLIIFLLKQRL
jgi:hypothetical protein